MEWLWTTERDQLSVTREKVSDMAVAMGGRIAEEILDQKVTPALLQILR